MPVHMKRVVFTVDPEPGKTGSPRVMRRRLDPISKVVDAGLRRHTVQHRLRNPGAACRLRRCAKPSFSFPRSRGPGRGNRDRDNRTAQHRRRQNRAPAGRHRSLHQRTSDPFGLRSECRPTRRNPLAGYIGEATCRWCQATVTTVSAHPIASRVSGTRLECSRS